MLAFQTLNSIETIESLKLHFKICYTFRPQQELVLNTLVTRDFESLFFLLRNCKKTKIFSISFKWGSLSITKRLYVVRLGN